MAKFNFNRPPFYVKAALLTVLVLGLAGGAATAVGVARTASGTSSKFDAVEIAHPQDVNDPVCTNSTTFTDMPGMTKTFQTGGLFTSPSPAIVGFQAQFMSPGSVIYNMGSVRLVVDGAVQDGSGSELSLSDPVGPTTLGRTWNFFTSPLSSGSHTAVLQWRTVAPLDPADPVSTQLCMQNRSMFIWHN